MQAPEEGEIVGVSILNFEKWFKDLPIVEERKVIPEVKKILDRVIEILKEKYHPEKVILFGSYVWGGFTKDSDIDLLIIKETDKKRIDRFVEVKRVIYNPEVKIPISPIVLTQKELDERINLGDDFLKEVVKKGITVYER